MDELYVKVKFISVFVKISIMYMTCKDFCSWGYMADIMKKENISLDLYFSSQKAWLLSLSESERCDLICTNFIYICIYFSVQQ